MGSCWGVEDISGFTTRQSMASPFYLYLLSCGISAPEDTEAAGPSTVDSKYLYLQLLLRLSGWVISKFTVTYQAERH